MGVSDRGGRHSIGGLEERATLSRLVWFAVTAGALATILGGFRFGFDHFVDFHPIVLALLDNDYLAGDFFVSAGREFGPRLFFAWIFAVLAPGPESLPMIYFMTTLLLNIATAALFGLLVRDLFRSNLAAMFAVGAAMSATFFRLAGASFMFADQPNANRLAFPFTIIGIWAAVRSKPVLVGLAAGIATLLHPVFGMEVGLLLLGSMAVSALIIGGSGRQRLAKLAKVAGGGGVLALASLLVLIPYGDSPRIPDDTLVEIMVLRGAHELIPSELGFEWVTFGLFLLGAGLAWAWTRRDHARKADEGRLFLNVFGVSILVSLAGGVVLTEFLPSRVGVIANPLHRLAFLLGWLGLLAIAGNAAKRARESSSAVGLFLYTTVISPVSVGLGHLLVWLRSGRGNSSEGGERSSLGIVWVLLGGLSLILGAAVTTLPRHIVLFIAVTATGAWLLLVRNRLLARLVPVGFVAFLAVALVGVQAVGGAPTAIDEVGPEIFPAHVDGSLVDIARRSQQVTPPDALFVTPPTFGPFRIFAERAIIADFKAFPYQEPAILEWRTRMFDQYGNPTDIGFVAEEQFDESYRTITDQRLGALCESYGATHAILYAETPTNLTVLDSNGEYSVVALNGCSSE
jgi:hypothetical protein